MVCTWLNEDEFERFSKVEDEDMNEVLQQVREINPVWYIDERTHYISRFLRKPIKQVDYTVYEIYEYNGIISKPEVRIQTSCGTKSNVMNFLFGLNIGYHFNWKKP